jgi:D-arabinose 1-dehydrogenase-like Zn-dependent alcohol dehydrogenase
LRPIALPSRGDVQGTPSRSRIAESSVCSRIGIAETQEVIDYCEARGIKTNIELGPHEQINTAVNGMVSKEVRYRFVIDMAPLKARQARGRHMK